MLKVNSLTGFGGKKGGSISILVTGSYLYDITDFTAENLLFSFNYWSFKSTFSSDNSTFYITDQTLDGIKSYDFSDPTSPVLLDSVVAGTANGIYPRCVHIHPNGNYAYTNGINSSGYLQIYNITDPSAMTYVTEFYNASLNNDSNDSDIDNIYGTLAVSVGTKILFLNTQTPESLSSQSDISVGGGADVKFRSSTHHAFVTKYGANTQFTSITVPQTGNHTILHGLSLATHGNVNKVALDLDTDVAYISTSTNRIVSVDISDASSMSVLSYIYNTEISTATEQIHVDSVTKKLYGEATSGGVFEIDVTDPSSMGSFIVNTGISTSYGMNGTN
jgi:hypothetical protein